jgi:hypothetical protein
VGTLKLKLGKDTQRTRSIYRDPESRRLRAAIEALAYESFAQRLDRTIARSGKVINAKPLALPPPGQRSPG